MWPAETTSFTPDGGITVVKTVTSLAVNPPRPLKSTIYALTVLGPAYHRQSARRARRCTIENVELRQLNYFVAVAGSCTLGEPRSGFTLPLRRCPNESA